MLSASAHDEIMGEFCERPIDSARQLNVESMSQVGHDQANRVLPAATQTSGRQA